MNLSKIKTTNFEVKLKKQREKKSHPTHPNICKYRKTGINNKK